MKKILKLGRIKVQNANAHSSPFSVGIPAMTAFLGAMHALQRHLNADGFDSLRFIGCAPVVHQHRLHVHKGQGDYVYSIVGTANPLDKSGKRPSFVEVPRIDLTISLLLHFETLDAVDDEMLKKTVSNLMMSRMRVAGGDVLEVDSVDIAKVEKNEDFHKLRNWMMPGHVLVERRDLLRDAMQQGEDTLDAFLSFLAIQNRSTADSDENVTWTKSRREPGWIVPIAVGFQGLTPLGEAKNQRDPNTPHRFAESVVTLGEFIMPYRAESLESLMWRYQPEVEKDLYLCTQEKEGEA